jgi:hypothetical protein
MSTVERRFERKEAMAKRNEARGAGGAGKITSSMLIVVVGCIGLAGCEGGGRGHQGGGGGASFPTGAVVAAALAATEIAAAVTSSSSPDSTRDPDPYIPAQPPPPVFPSPHPSFEPAAALAAIDGADYASCRAAHTLGGWYHARVTFEPTGSVSRVLIDWTPALVPSAVACLQAQVGTATVPRFEGPAVTVGAAVFVP